MAANPITSLSPQRHSHYSYSHIFMDLDNRKKDLKVRDMDIIATTEVTGDRREAEKDVQPPRQPTGRTRNKKSCYSHN